MFTPRAILRWKVAGGGLCRVYEDDQCVRELPIFDHGLEVELCGIVGGIAASHFKAALVALAEQFEAVVYERGGAIKRVNLIRFKT